MAVAVTRRSTHRKCLSGHQVIAQVKAIATKTDNLNLIPGTHMVQKH